MNDTLNRGNPNPFTNGNPGPYSSGNPSPWSASNGGSIEARNASQWSDAMPKTMGLWEVRCAETGEQAERVAITRFCASLWVHSGDVGVNPVKHFHDGLTAPTWRKIA